MQFLAQLGQLAFAVGLLLDGRFFDFQLGFALKIGGVALGVVEDLSGFGFGVAAAQAIEQFD